ncbi:MAG: phosphate propanoyltransferase [Anaerovoracaceae bacterium]
MDSSPDAIAARAAGKEVSASCCSTAECCTTAATGIPVGVSNRHLHLSEQDLATLFGEGYEFTRIKDLSQPGQYACKELVTICGPKGAIEKVRVLGPARSKTQVEILKSDSFKLGISAPTRISGDLEGTPGVTIIGPKGSVQTKEGLIISQRHIHMTPGDAANYGVTDGQLVDICVEGERGGIYKNVIIRANDASALECHVDNDEANAMDINSKSVINIIK